MKGLELSKNYFFEFGLPMLESEFPDILDKIAVGLSGSGSECFGFDDEVSTDHDFEPGFCIWIPGEDVIDRQRAFKLERAYSKLPNEYKGFKRPLISPVGGSRHGVMRIDEYLTSKVGSTLPLDIYQWISLPSYALAEAINGEIWIDNLGMVTNIRKELSTMPEDARLKRLAGQLFLMAQSGQYNFERCINHGEQCAAILALNQFVNATLESIFLLNKEYMPYYKWSFRALKQLDILTELYEPLEFLLLGDSSDLNGKLFTIGEVCNAIQNELRNQDITKMGCDDMEKHAYSVNDFIQNNEIRNLGILYAI